MKCQKDFSSIHKHEVYIITPKNQPMHYGKKGSKIGKILTHIAKK